MSLSFLVFHVLSFKKTSRIILGSILQPLIFLILLSINHSGLDVSSLMFYVLLAILCALIGVKAFLLNINAVGVNILGIPSLTLIKAFLANWTVGLEKPFEDILEQLSEKREITVSLMAFKAQNKLKTIIVVPKLHAGPFKNVGSSAIPSLIQSSFEKNFGCIVSVPHGTSGHEVDLASQTQNQRFLEQLIKNAKFDTFDKKATPFMTVCMEGATAGCQIFGDSALVTLTLAPETMEDLPLEIDEAILFEAKRKGLSWAITIDAHNSIQGIFDIERSIEPLKNASKAVIQYASNYEKKCFEVGVAKVKPTKFGLKEGFGPGGITVTVIRVNGKINAYVTIDGNNMVSGLREKILLSLVELGIDNGEVFTTDTHMVNAIVLNKRGYNPIGEAIEHEILIEEINKAVKEALKNLEPAEFSWQQIVVQGVKVVGEKQLDKLSLTVNEGTKMAKKTSALIFPVVGFLLTFLLYIL